MTLSAAELQGTASEATFVALLAARSKVVATTTNDDNIGDGHILSKLVAYCSDQVTENNVASNIWNIENITQ